MTLPHPAPFRRLVRMHDEPVSLRRRDSTTSSQYGSEITYSSLSDDRHMYIDDADEFEQSTMAGEFQSAQFVGFAIPSEDIQVNDRFDHGSITLEVTAKVGVPDNTDPILYQYALDRP